MASMLAGLGTLFLLFSLVILSHTVQIGIAIIVAAATAGLLMFLRSPAVAFAEEPSVRVPAQRSPAAGAVTVNTTPERELARI